jgi:hypothetical protein
MDNKPGREFFPLSQKKTHSEQCRHGSPDFGRAEPHPAQSAERPLFCTAGLNRDRSGGMIGAPIRCRDTKD